MSVLRLALGNPPSGQIGITAATGGCLPLVRPMALLAGLCLFSGLAPARLLMAQQTEPQSLGVTHESSSSPSNHSFWSSRGRLNFGFQVAYTVEHVDSFRPSHINLLYAQPQLGIVVSDFHAHHIPLSRLEVINEGALGGSVHPGGRLIGYVLLFRLDGSPWGRTIPFFDMGAGVLNTTLNTRAPELTGSTQFNPQAGFGVQYFFRPQRAFVLEYRYLHMSNNNLQLPNLGFNSSMLTLGFRWLLRPRPTVLNDTHK